MIRVTVNGEAHELDEGTSVATLVARFNLAPPRVAVEVNEDLVPRRSYDATALKDGDRVEIVTFVGGG
jgi:sulfur carrier protein